MGADVRSPAVRRSCFFFFFFFFFFCCCCCFPCPPRSNGTPLRAFVDLRVGARTTKTASYSAVHACTLFYFNFFFAQRGRIP